jgi:hypothetical protein
MNKRFRVTIGSDVNLEDLSGDLYFDDQIVCVLTQEEGFENLKLELFGPPPKGKPHGDKWTFPLREFEEALAKLKQRLWELRRTEPQSEE